MHTSASSIVLGLVFILGLALLVGGIIVEKHGAVVIGLIVAAASVQQYVKRNKATAQKQTGHAS